MKNVIESGYCQCGCGNKTLIAHYTKNSKGIKKGVPLRFINGHHSVLPRAESRIVMIDGEPCRTIPLSETLEALIDIDKYPIVSRWIWGAMVSKSGSVYAARTFMDHGTSKRVWLHRFLLGIEDPTIQVDHVSMNTLDNRLCNLRAANRSQNNHNRTRQKNNTSGYKGVGFHAGEGKYRARIRANGKSHFLGWFDTAQEAHSAYQKAAVEMHREFARTT